MEKLHEVSELTFDYAFLELLGKGRDSLQYDWGKNEWLASKSVGLFEETGYYRMKHQEQSWQLL